QGRRGRDFKRGLSHADSAAGGSHRLAQGKTDMKQHPMRRDAPGPITAASTPVEARKLAENLMEHMSALLAVIARETELVRARRSVGAPPHAACGQPLAVIVVGRRRLAK